MVEEKSETVIKFEKTERRLKIIFWIGVPIFFLTPWFFTRSSCFWWLDFTETANIGATIGGITAPFFSLLASVIVYFSFRAQTQMNIIQQTKFDSIEKEKEKKEFDDLLTKLFEKQADAVQSIIETSNSGDIKEVETVQKMILNKNSIFIDHQIRTPEKQFERYINNMDTISLKVQPLLRVEEFKDKMTSMQKVFFNSIYSYELEHIRRVLWFQLQLIDLANKSNGVLAERLFMNIQEYKPVFEKLIPFINSLEASTKNKQ